MKTVPEIAIDKLTEEFDRFIQSCLVGPYGEIVTPSYKSVMRARGCIPKGYKSSLVRS